MIIKANKFSRRSDLEREVNRLVGKTVDPKPDYEITGTVKDLKKLRLSERNTVWGVKCIATDAPPVKKVKRPQRGKRYESKLE